MGLKKRSSLSLLFLLSTGSCSLFGMDMDRHYEHFCVGCRLEHNEDTFCWKNPPLVAAAALGDTRTVRRLLADGADANIKNQVDVTPLLAAAQEGYTEIVQLLLAESGNCT